MTIEELKARVIVSVLMLTGQQFALFGWMLWEWCSHAAGAVMWTLAVITWLGGWMNRYKGESSE